MIDTINPMNFDLTKNLHGHVRVELRDRWTGRVVDSQEKDNLVTNAAQKITMLYRWAEGGGSSGFASFAIPMYRKTLGGILLFNGTLTESADNIYMPADAKLVAYAGQTANSDDPHRGSYNSVESVFSSTGFTTVWDFATSQGNGTIASLSRTWYGFENNMVYGQSVAPQAQSTGSTLASILGYDEANSYVYITPYPSDVTVGGITYSASTIYRAKLKYFQMGINDCLPPCSQWTAIKTLTSSDGTTSAHTFIYDQYDNNFVCSPNATTIHIIAMDGTHTSKTLSGVNGTNFCVTENYYWKWSGRTVYRIDKSNVSNVETFTYEGGTTNYLRVHPYEHDIIFVGPDDGAATELTMLYPDWTEYVFTIPNTNVYGITRHVALSRPLAYYGSVYRSYLFVDSNYLGTIANLSSPVTKTSSQTMKITYTLTEA